MAPTPAGDTGDGVGHIARQAREQPLALGVALAAERAPREGDIADPEQTSEVWRLRVRARIEAECAPGGARHRPRRRADREPQAGKVPDHRASVHAADSIASGPTAAPGPAAGGGRSRSWDTPTRLLRRR